MKRDMELIRKILFAIEASDCEPLDWIELKIDGYSDSLVSYHVQLLSEAGLVDAIDSSTMGNYEVNPRRLTWHGHEFLDTVRDPGVWHKTEAEVVKLGDFGFDMLRALAKGYLKKKIEEHTDIKLEF